MIKRQWRIVHLTSAHSWDDVRIFQKECRSLAAAGYDVTIVCPSRDSFYHDGVRILGVPEAKSRIGRAIRTATQVCEAAVRLGADVFHLHDPELLVASMLLGGHGAKVVYDSHEDVREQVLTKQWIPAWARGMVSLGIGLVEDWRALGVDAIVAATPHIARRFPDSKVVVINNYALTAETMTDTVSYAERGPRIVYVGAISRIRGAVEMVRVAEILNRHFGASARLALVGDVESDDLHSTLNCMAGWEYVDYMGRQPRHVAMDTARAARVGLALFHPAPNHVCSQPNKLFEYMACGTPVVASDFPCWREIVERTGCGLLVDPLEPQETAEAVAWLLENPGEAAEMGERGRRAAMSTFCWESQVAVLLGLYERLLS